MNTAIKLGMVGGGQGAFIGAVHRMAARLDGQYELVAGALSSDPERAIASGQELGLDRIYTDFNEMARVEAARVDRIQAVAIVTPNHVHFAAVKVFLEAGIHVICDKPLTASLEEAETLAALHPKNGAKFLLTHNYTGYPMVRLARDLIAAGHLGEIRLVQVEYLQDWLADDVSNKQADWRTDPTRAGMGGAIGDIGTHAYNLLRFVTQLKPEFLSADLYSFVPRRSLDDNAQLMLRFTNGARGMLLASQVAHGNENELTIRVYGEDGGLEWAQDDCNTLWYAEAGKPKQMLRRGGTLPHKLRAPDSRIPAGHPEGYIEAFATLYSDFVKAIRNENDANCLPTVQDGLEGVQFITTAVKSSAENGKWLKL